MSPPVRRAILLVVVCGVVAASLYGMALWIDQVIQPMPEARRSARTPIPRSAQRIDRRRYIRERPLVARKASRETVADPVEPDRSAGPEGVLPPDPEGIPNEYILAFFNEADRRRFAELARARGLGILGTLARGNVLRLRAEDEQVLQALLRAAPTPVRFERNIRVKPPAPPGALPMPPTGAYVGFGTRALEWLGSPQQADTWGQGVTVAVLDTWVHDHPTLAGADITRLSMLGNTGPTAGLYEGHGTAVASLIVGHHAPAQGLAPGSRLLAIEVLDGSGGGNSFSLAEGILEAVARGARVINLCLGSRSDSFVLRDAVAYAVEQGVAVVAAVGNDAIAGVAYPARYDGVIGVAAGDAAGQHLFFSNRGPEVDIAAPGLGVAAAAPGAEVRNFSGTSAATPFVAAAVAGTLSEDPALSAAGATEVVLRYSNDAGAPGADEAMGQGILDVRRIETRDETGIYDIAVNPPYFPRVGGGDTDLRVVLAAQNRGTMPLAGVDLVISQDGSSQTMHFSDVAVGQTVSHELRFGIDRLKALGPMVIGVRAVALNVIDIHPSNNARTLAVSSGE